jgi:ABC-2 type transport system ATP-binding protein
LRGFLADFASRGGTVLLSSQLINEISLFADNLLVIAQGSLIASETLDSFVKRRKPTAFKVRTEHSEKFLQVLRSAKMTATRLSDDVVEISAERSIGFLKVAVSHDIEIAEVMPVGSSVEDIFLELTAGMEGYAATIVEGDVEPEGKSS